MEEAKGFDRRAHLINELLQGMEFAKELRNQILNPTNSNSSSTSSNDDSSDDNKNDSSNQVALNNNSLLEKMLSSFDKTISIAKMLNIQFPQDPNPNHSYPHLSESNHSLTISSPKSENSHIEFSPSKKRKTIMMPKWTKIVQIGNEGVVKGLEGALEDGYSWRKYGQKEILGAKFPRGYYRCTHRHTKGCAATKQVQRSDEDPSIYQIMYRGDHTCTKGAQLVKAQSKAQYPPIIPAQFKLEPQPPPSPNQHEVYLGLGPEGDLKVEPELEALEPLNHAQIFRSFSFTSTHLQTYDPNDNYMLSFYPAFGSPNTSESNYLPVSPYQVTNPHVGFTVQTSETDNNYVVSGPNSVTNSPVMMGDFEFPIDDFLNFECNFPF